MSIRITGLGEVSTIQSGDFVAIDNATNGTHKFDATKLGASVSTNIAPAYSTAATYAVGEFCMHDNYLYRCTVAITSPEAWTASHWVQVTVGASLYSKVDKVSGKGLSQNDFTNTLKTKLDGIEAGAEVNVQADWAEADNTKDDYIKNKPVNATQSTAGFMSAADKTKLDGIASGAEVNVQANWNETNTSSDAYIQNKPTNATGSSAGFMSAADKTKLDGIAAGAEVNVQSDWNVTDNTSDAYIKNKPSTATQSTAGFMSSSDKTKLDGIEAGAEVNVQADWAQTNTSADDYIKNKPNVIETVKVDGVALTPSNNAVDITGKANESIVASEYSTNESYVIGDYVLRSNVLYVCIDNTSGTWNSAKWSQVVLTDEINHLDDLAKLYDDMSGSTQTLAWTDDMVTSVTHKVGSTTIRTDTFTYSAGTFTEVRTLNNGATLTLATDLSTYVTTVTYVGA